MTQGWLKTLPTTAKQLTTAGLACIAGQTLRMDDDYLTERCWAFGPAASNAACGAYGWQCAGLVVSPWEMR